MNNEQIIAQVRRRATLQKLADARAIREAKRQAAKENAEYNLFLDDCKANGIDINKPEGRALALHGWMMKLGELRREDEEDEPVLTDGDIFL